MPSLKFKPTASERLLGMGLEWLVHPFRQFSRLGAAGGILLLVCTAAAMFLANSEFAHLYHHFFHDTKFGVKFGDSQIMMSLGHWINDALMAVFFFMVGLEIKREVMAGELATARRAALPIVAAIAGMAVPALVYFAFNPTGDDARGWGIPMATDIAFALGILTLVGKRAPVSLKIFLAALAIADDIGAVLVIAVFYTEQLAVTPLLTGMAVVGVSLILNIAGVRNILVYVALGAILWLAFLESGVHATIAGVLLAMTIPSRGRLWEEEFVATCRDASEKLDAIESNAEHPLTSRRYQEAVHAMEQTRKTLSSPLLSMEHALLPVVTFFIMPLFAFANAGVTIEGNFWQALMSPVSLGIIFGLFVGKQAGVFLATWLAVKLRIADLSRGVTWKHIYGVSLLAGIGFTMSLFIANLAFREGDPDLPSAKIGILTASFLSGIVGYLVLRSAAEPADDPEEDGDNGNGDPGGGAE